MACCCRCIKGKRSESASPWRMTMDEPALPPEHGPATIDPRRGDGQFTVYTPADSTGLALNLEVLGALFEQHDRDGAGGLALDEFKALCGKVCATRGLDDREVEAAFRRADVSNTGDVAFAELRAWFEDEANGDTLSPPTPPPGPPGTYSRRAVSEEWPTAAGRVVKARVGGDGAAAPRGLAALFACGGAGAAAAEGEGVARWFALGRLDEEADDGAAWPHYALRWFASEAAARAAPRDPIGSVSVHWRHVDIHADGGGEGATTLELVTSSAPGLLVLRFESGREHARWWVALAAVEARTRRLGLAADDRCVVADPADSLVRLAGAELAPQDAARGATPIAVVFDDDDDAAADAPADAPAANARRLSLSGEVRRAPLERAFSLDARGADSQYSLTPRAWLTARRTCVRERLGHKHGVLSSG